MIDRSTRRARLTLAASAAAWGAAIAAVSVVAGALVGIAIAVWRSRRLTRPALVRAIDAAASARNVIVTADELIAGRLSAKPAVRDRVIEAAARLAMTVNPRAIAPWTPFVRAVGAAAIVWTLVATATLSRGPVGAIARTATNASGVLAVSGAASIRIHVTVQPPSYTGAPVTTTVDPQEIRALEHSIIDVRVDPPMQAVIEHDDRTTDARFAVVTNGYVTVAAAGLRRVIPIVVTPDALPAVRVTAPGRDLVFRDATPTIAFNVEASDDYGLRSLTLQFTKVSGSGEEYTFSDGEIPMTIQRKSGREWIGTASRSLASLGLKDGDMLVYRGSALDARPGDGRGTSDAFFVEISKLGIAAGDAFTLPEEETRYALSEQMLIIKTDRLAKQRASMPAADFADASTNLAVEQRMIRAEFVFMLGGEIEDEEVEAEQSIELQAGRLANRGQRDLRDATTAMSQAEKILTGVDPFAALAAERAAVTALQRAFARDRYLLRALASRSQLDLQRRLTGDRSEAQQIRTPVPRTPENRRAAQLEDLLRGVTALAHDSRGGGIDRQRLAVFAATALRIDSDSAELRRVAADLQRASDPAALNAIATSLGDEVRRALADAPPLLPHVAPRLRGALEAQR